MKVWLVMAHEGPAEDDNGPSSVGRVFGSPSEANAFLEALEQLHLGGVVE